MSAFATSVVVPLFSRLLLRRSSRLHRACVVWGGVCHRLRVARAPRFEYVRHLRFRGGAEESAVDIKSKGGTAPASSPVRNTTGPACKTKPGCKRKLRRAALQPLVEISAAQLRARRSRTVWRSLRPGIRRRGQPVFESVNDGGPHSTLNWAHTCEQLGFDVDLASHLCEEDDHE